MTEMFQKRIEDGDVIFDNSEARWVFSKGRPPHIDDYVVTIYVVDKSINIPVMMHMSGVEFRKLLSDMGIINPNTKRI